MADLNATAAAALAALDNGPNTAWGVARGLEAAVGAFWNVTQSQVYRELSRLAEAKLVRAAKGRGPRDSVEYQITAAGRRALDGWLHEAPGEDVVRIPFLLKVCLGDGRLDDETLADFAAGQRARHQEQLAFYEQLQQGAGERQALLLQYGILHERAVLAWLDGLPW